MEANRGGGMVRAGSREEVSKHAENYAADVQKKRSKAAEKQQAELKKLERIEKEYGPTLLSAFEREAGGDAEAIKQKLKELVEERDATIAAEKARALRREHGHVVARALSSSGIDRKAARRKLLAAIGRLDLAETDENVVETAALAELDELIESDSLGFSIVPPKPPKPPPAPPVTVTNLDPPYPISFLSTDDEAYARADTATGTLFAWSTAVMAGSFRTLASVGRTFSVDARVRHVRVEATLDQRYSTGAMGLGYASAEAKLNLLARDGAQEVASDRRSLARSIAVVLWLSSANGSGPVDLFCEFDRTPGTPASYSAIIEAEVWSGAGGSAMADAKEEVRGLPKFRALLYT